MPIRFRCAYCNQLMGISHRKAGTVVRCPKCAGQVVVPEDESPSPSPEAGPEAGLEPGPGGDVSSALEDPELELLLAGAAKDVGGQKPKSKRKHSKVYPEVDVEPLDVEPPMMPPVMPAPLPEPAPMSAPMPAPMHAPTPAPATLPSSPSIQASMAGLTIPHNVLMVAGVVIVVLIGAAFLFGYYVGRGS